MQISSAYLYGSGMSEGQVPTPVLPDNVIFDQGVFNMNRMKAGFSLDNVLTSQEKYSGIPYYQGDMPITQGGFAQEIQADDGTVFANLGTNNEGMQIVGQALQHIGTEDYDYSKDGCNYFFPIDFDTLRQEGYSKLCIDMDYSTQGIVNPTSAYRRIEVYLYYVSGNGLAPVGSQSFNLNDTPDFVQHTLELSPSYLDYVPAYLELVMTHGTYNIYKMWFE